MSTYTGVTNFQKQSGFWPTLYNVVFKDKPACIGLRSYKALSLLYDYVTLDSIILTTANVVPRWHLPPRTEYCVGLLSVFSSAG